jgi:hypothetical protein
VKKNDTDIKNINDLTSKFFSPIEIPENNININPERKIEKKHQGQLVFKIFSKT